MTKETIRHERFPLAGMHCAACAGRAERTLSRQPGVTEATVNFASAEASVSYRPAEISPAQMKEALAPMGFELLTGEHKEELEDRQRQYYRSLRRRALTAVLLSVAVMTVSMLPLGGSTTTRIAAWMLATPVVFGAGREFFASAWRQLRQHTSNMDTLVALSTGIAYAFSVFNVLCPSFWTARGVEPHVYFDSSCGVITFILIGRLLEERAKRSTASSLRKLIGLQPRTTTVILPDGSQAERSIATVRPGDLLEVKPGEKIAVDGTVTEGNSYVDESLMSGEPVPVLKESGQKVFAGTLNGRGSFRYRAEHVGSETMLARIIDMVRNAQNSKAPVQRLTDRIAAVFVPVVITLSLLTFVLWLTLSPAEGVTRGLLAAVTVLVIACPCALGLATPTALMAGMGRAAERGILVRDAESLQTARRIDTIVLDKTGTVTEGRPEVTEVMTTDNGSTLPILTALERRSEHPLAEAVVRRWEKAENLPVEDFISLTGLGVRGRCEDSVYYAGNIALLRHNGILPPEKLLSEAGRLEEQGRTVIWFASASEVLALVAISDRVRNGSREAVATLQQKGIEVHLLTGDSEATARHIAGETGISRFKGGVLPEEKADYVKRLHEAGRTVAMTGDGINDSAALACADLSIAMSGGSDVAMDIAQMTLVHPDLRLLPEAVRLSRRTVGVIRQNLFWAFFYNVIGIPIAAGALYPTFGFQLSPMLAGAAMALSSVSVVCNSLRLKL